MTATLDAQVLAAHAAGDRAALAALYAKAAAMAPERDAEAFYLTQAYVYALEAGDSAAKTLHARLAALGREPG